MESRSQRSILITGGTTGLGYHCALSIARQYPNDQVVIASRSDPNASAGKINELLGQNNVQFRRLDLSSLPMIRSFAAEWKANQFPPIHSLVFNAALQFPGKVEYTEDGFEKTFAISHIGHALLFCLLRPHFAENVRIVIVSSGTHDPAQKTGMPHAYYHSAEELAHPARLSAQKKGRQRYTNAKLANVLFAYALHRRFTVINERHGKNWTVTAFDPGLMPGTGLAREAGSVEKFVWLRVLPRIIPLLRLLLTHNIHTTQESGEALARLSVSSDVEGASGVYYEGRREIKSSEASYDETKQEDLWQWTMSTIACNGEENTTFGLRDLC